MKNLSRWRTRSHNYIAPDPLIVPHLEHAGFGDVVKIANCTIDQKFILAMVERWRPETHTFHLPIGECTITLEDVYMLLGLKIDGDAVNGPVMVSDSLCEELLGKDMVDPRISRGQGIFLSELKKHYATLQLNENSSEEDIVVKCRNYLMILFGSLLFPESTGNSINMMYLTLLRDFDKISTYSWGSAVLAHLYSALCKNAKKDACTFFGCAFLLQAWGWWRMPSLNPENDQPFVFPYATR